MPNREPQTSAETSAIVKHDHRFASATAGYTVLLRNKVAIDFDDNSPQNTVLFVHGATYGSTYTFDYAVDGYSWMDWMALSGFNVWCIDLLGYGGSDRPHEMDEPPDQNAPLVDTRHAVAEIDGAIDFILRESDIEQLSLIGYSWGTAICGAYAGQFPHKVSRLVLSGALWVERGNAPRGISAEMGAYRTVQANSAMRRWAIGLSQDDINRIVAPELVKQWCEDVVQSDPKANEANPPLLRAPSGVLKDYTHCASSGDPWYDPGLIIAATQIVVGEFDQETTPQQAASVFSKLRRATEKRMTVIGDGTHTLLLERNRHALFDVVASFLLSA
ncbi:MAG: alpha/beta fold hydrolase [Proteobacteria bacterium]|nr:alpha/beta fold hydrolase [Pseudomonadota bacterium]